MAAIIAIEEEVGADGRVVLHLTPGQRVRITVEEAQPALNLTPEEEAAIDAEIAAILADPNFGKGSGLRSDEIARSAEAIGIWKDRPETQDSVAWIAEQRRKRRERNQNRD